jgi:hypothetical protein
MLAVFGACGGRGDLLDIDPEDFGEPGQDGAAVAAACPVLPGKARTKPC